MTQLAASVITSFGNAHWKQYAEQMLTSFVRFWPAQIPILCVLDDETLMPEVQKLLRPQDAVMVHSDPERAKFLERNKDKDHVTDYRKQACRFCHKVFALKGAADFWKSIPGPENARYVIWWDADVLTTRPVTLEEVSRCLPKDGDAVSYLGRKDWGHSECGWLAFDLNNRGDEVIKLWHENYIGDHIFNGDEWHDSWAFDSIIGARTPDNPLLTPFKTTNLTADKPGMEIWPQSPMAAWSRHYKGPIAKQELIQGHIPDVPGAQVGGMNLKIQTKNSIPDEQIQKNILENQAQIKQWITLCKPLEEELVIVSAGPMLVPEMLEEEIAAGRRIVAVKHALEPLRNAGIKPWACILLDPRDHVYKFVENPDKDILWLVCSQVTPKAVKSLLDAGCNVWGYHAAVGANEHVYTEKQKEAIISGGSATATRGLFLLDRLGFRNFRLYGYDLCFPDKPNLQEKDEIGQPKYFEIMLDANAPHYQLKRGFWSKGELLAQYQEFCQIIQMNQWKIKAFGHGIVPFMVEAKQVSDLRGERKKAKMTDKLNSSPSCDELFGCKTDKTDQTVIHLASPQAMDLSGQ